MYEGPKFPKCLEELWIFRIVCKAGVLHHSSVHLASVLPQELFHRIHSFTRVLATHVSINVIKIHAYVVNKENTSIFKDINIIISNMEFPDNPVLYVNTCDSNCIFMEKYTQCMKDGNTRTCSYVLEL